MNNLLFHTMVSASVVIFQFDSSSTTEGWRIINDGVMGGKSTSMITVNSQGNGVFQGKVVTDGGGFCSLRYNCNLEDVRKYRSLRIRVKGDGKTYQCRIVGKRGDYHQYTFSIDTTGEWEVLDIPLNKFTPIFRGQHLEIPKYDGRSIQEVGFLIADGQAGNFKLVIDRIGLLE